MQTQDLSYKLNNQKITVLNAKDMLPYDVSVEVFSLENVYTVAENTYARRGGEYFSMTVFFRLSCMGKHRKAGRERCA